VDILLRHGVVGVAFDIGNLLADCVMVVVGNLEWVLRMVVLYSSRGAYSACYCSRNAKVVLKMGV